MQSRKNNFNKIERFLAGQLSSAPTFKKFLKKFYIILVWLIRRKNYRFRTPYMIEEVGQTTQESFFGYYDKSPVNDRSDLILYHETERETRNAPECQHSVSIVLAKFPSGDEIARLTTKAYNLQQGAKTQWLSSNKFIYNDFDENSKTFVSKIWDVDESRIVKTLKAPIYDCYEEKFALTLDFDRLTKLESSYGYACSEYAADRFDKVNEDGVWHVDILTSDVQLILSFKTLIELNEVPSMKKATHSVNHIMISPCGTRFIVLHRWHISGRRYDRLILSNLSGTEVVILADEGMVSHCCWLSSDTILAYLRHEQKNGYWLIDCVTQEKSQYSGAQSLQHGDGHPHACGKWFVTDSYPDKARMQHLYLCDLFSGDVVELGEFYHAISYTDECRCDLHPRLSKDGRWVFFDSVFSGKRRLHYIRL